MEYQQKLILITAVLVIVALYFAFTSAPAKLAPMNTTAQQYIVMSGLSLGSGQAQYVYSYSDVSDGYKNVYIIEKGANGSSVEIQNPLSDKTVYFMPNDTILCINFLNQTCSSVSGHPEVNNYISYLQGQEISDSSIARNKDNMAALIAGDYLTFSPDIVNTTINGNPCSEVSYTIDFTSITLNDAARFSIGSNTPKLFNFSLCVGDNGVMYARDFNYTYNNTMHTDSYRLLSWIPGPVQVTPPINLTDGAIGLLTAEGNAQAQLGACYTNNQGENRDGCIIAIAIQLQRKDLCDYAGIKRDSCLISIAAIDLDSAICQVVSNPSMKDDCYMELAGGYRNSTYCSYIQNASEMSQCQNVSTPIVHPPANTTSSNSTNSTTAVAGNSTSSGNSTNSSADVNALMTCIDTGTCPQNSNWAEINGSSNHS